MTNVEMMVALKNALSTNQQWALRALVRIYQDQTQAEKDQGTTHDHNNIGFSGVDGELLSSFAQQYMSRGRLSDKQMVYVFKKMPKYWKQLVNIAGKEKMVAALANLGTAQA